MKRPIDLDLTLYEAKVLRTWIPKISTMPMTLGNIHKRLVNKIDGHNRHLDKMDAQAEKIKKERKTVSKSRRKNRRR